MKIHDVAKQLYQKGYRSHHEPPGRCYTLTDGQGNIESFTIDQPAGQPLFSSEAKEWKLKQTGNNLQFEMPDYDLTDQLLMQIEEFGNTTDGFLCDLGNFSDAAKLASLVREYVKEFGEKFTEAFLGEPVLPGLAFVIKMVAVVCSQRKQLSENEFTRSMRCLKNLAKDRGLYP